MSEESCYESEDIFEEKEYGTPVEFSGVSASGTSSSPASQAVRLQPTGSPQPSTSTAPQLHACHFCRKIFKTALGLRKHVDSHACHQGQLGNVSESVSPLKEASSQPKEFFNCGDCPQSFKTRGGFLKHRASHKIKDANKRKPNGAKFKDEALHAVMESIVQEIASEPNYGEANSPKIRFLKEFWNKEGSNEWKSFTMELVDVVCSLVCEKQTKIFPQNQYEDILKKLNCYMNQNISILKEKLLLICEENISPALAGRLVFRMASKLLEKVQCWALQKMRSYSSNIQPESAALQTMTMQEKQSFLVSLGSFFRDFYYRSSRNTTLCQTQNVCLRETFVVGPAPISRREFLRKGNWFSGDEHCIIPSEYASKFFLAIEVDIIRAQNIVITQEVLEKIVEDFELLNVWYHLTAAHFSEEMALLFMRNLVSFYLKVSLNLEERRINAAEEKCVQATTVALRTHLKRNVT